MLTESMRLKLEYEQIRLGRYGGIKQGVAYSNEDLYEAYELWATATGNREREWDTYSDIRDGVPRGTNWRIRRKRMETLGRFH